jgi:endonuclease III
MQPRPLVRHRDHAKANALDARCSDSKAIYPVSFYRVKARTIHTICEQLLDRFRGHRALET